MTDTEKLAELRIILEDTDDDDATLLSYLEQAGEAILNRLYPYQDEIESESMEIPKRYEYKQLQIAAFLLNKRGAEGETQHIENGIHRNYRDPGVPFDMLSDIYPLIGIPR